VEGPHSELEDVAWVHAAIVGLRLAASAALAVDHDERDTADRRRNAPRDDASASRLRAQLEPPGHALAPHPRAQLGSLRFVAGRQGWRYRGRVGQPAARAREPRPRLHAASVEQVAAAHADSTAQCAAQSLCRRRVAAAASARGQPCCFRRSDWRLQCLFLSYHGPHKWKKIETGSSWARRLFELAWALATRAGAPIAVGGDFNLEVSSERWRELAEMPSGAVFTVK